jgi:hypothetical protein
MEYIENICDTKTKQYNVLDWLLRPLSSVITRRTGFTYLYYYFTDLG